MPSIVKFLATFGYIGYAPFWPGAFGSLAGVLLAWYGYGHLLAMAIFFNVLGLAISKPAAGVYQKKDPQAFVLDEVGGMMITLLTLPKAPEVFITGYALFRVFDVWKPGFIGRLERIRSATSIMWDDIAAGAVSNLILQIIFRLCLNY